MYLKDEDLFPKEVKGLLENGFYRNRDFHLKMCVKRKNSWKRKRQMQEDTRFTGIERDRKRKNDEINEILKKEKRQSCKRAEVAIAQI